MARPAGRMRHLSVMISELVATKPRNQVGEVLRMQGETLVT